MDLFDSHCHLSDEAFAGEVDVVLRRARVAGVSGLVTIASDLDDAVVVAALAASNDGVWCSAGIHPHAAAAAAPDAADQIRARAQSPGVVAIGETGLDFHYDNSPRDAQRRLFEMHLELAGELSLPVVVHARSADDEMCRLIRAWSGRVKGVLHCFTGGRGLLDTALAADWHVSFAGLVTFRRFDGEALVRAVPSDRLLIETDSPYLAPVPMRGRRNEPGFIGHTCARLADIRGEAPEVLARVTSRNARAFYGIDAQQPIPVALA